MYRGLVLTALLGWVAAQTGVQCPLPWNHYHSEYLNAARGSNDADIKGTFPYQLEFVGEDYYVEGKTHAIKLLVNGKNHPIQSFVITALPQDSNTVCGYGSFAESGPHAQAMDDCPQVLRTGDLKHTKNVDIRWTAPQCGCISIRATIITTQNVYYTDADDAIHGPLTRTICPKGSDSLDTNKVETYPDIIDYDYYGLNEDEEEDVDYEIDPEFGVPIEDEDDDVEETTDDIEDAELEELEEEMEEDLEEAEEEGKDNKKKQLWRKFIKRAKKIMKKKGLNLEKKVVKQKMVQLAKKLHSKVANKLKPTFKSRWNQMPSKERREHLCRRITANKMTPRRRMMQKRSKNNPRIANLLEQINNRRHSIKLCCKMETEEGRDQCFEEYKEERFDTICETGGQLMHPRMMLPRHQHNVKEECCELNGAARYECFAEQIKQKRHVNAKNIQRPAPVTPATRFNKLCTRIVGLERMEPRNARISGMDPAKREAFESHWHSRKSALLECCEMHSEEDRLECVAEMREERWDRVCDDNEPIHWMKEGNARPHPPFVTKCCAQNGEERYGCFEGVRTKLMQKKQKKVRQPKKMNKRMKKHDQKLDELSAEELEVREQKIACCHQGKVASRRVEEDRRDACSTEGARYALTNEGVDREMCSAAFERCCVFKLRKSSLKKHKPALIKQRKLDRKLMRQQRFKKQGRRQANKQQ